MVVERPQHAGMLDELQSGEVLSVLLVRDSVRLQGRCRIVSRTRFELNEHTRVVALQLAPAEDVGSAQRRQFFRVSAAGEDVPPVLLQPLLPDADAEGGYRDADLDVIKAKLVNIGGGGVGLIVSASQALLEALPNCRYYDCCIELPAVQECVRARGQLVHIQPNQDKTFYLGMKFAFATPRERRVAEDQVVKFTTNIERRHLRHKRA